MENNKRVTAAISAVMSYIREENESSAAAIISSQQQSLWGLSGRQALMQQRILMQMKAFHGKRMG
jgi:hypothetical protein